MEYFVVCDQQEFKTQMKEKEFLGKDHQTLPLYTWNQWQLYRHSLEKTMKNPLFLCVNTKSASVNLKRIQGKEQGPALYLQGKLLKKDITRVLEQPETERNCILMNTSMIDEAWCAPALRPYLHPADEVCVLAFSFFDDTRTLEDWKKQYAPGQGVWYRANTDVFRKFGIKPDQVHWVNYFTDSTSGMLAKIAASNVLLFTGGAPDLMMKRIREKKLKRLLKQYTGTVIGYSAGAMIQLEQYHITPDEDYPVFGWHQGLGYLSGFDIEVHYTAGNHQKRYIEKAQDEKGLDVYAIYEKGGLIVDARGSITCFGKVDLIKANA